MKCSGFLLKTIRFFSNQSSFKTGDSCINQVSSITLEIYVSLLMTGLTLEVFFLISQKPKIKFSARVKIIFKLKLNGISGKLLCVLSDFSKERKQRLTLIGQIS